MELLDDASVENLHSCLDSLEATGNTGGAPFLLVNHILLVKLTLLLLLSRHLLHQVSTFWLW